MGKLELRIWTSGLYEMIVVKWTMVTPEIVCCQIMFCILIKPNKYLCVSSNQTLPGKWSLPGLFFIAIDKSCSKSVKVEI